MYDIFILSIILITQPNIQPNFNSIQSNFNPGWGYKVIGLKHPPHKSGTNEMQTHCRISAEKWNTNQVWSWIGLSWSWVGLSQKVLKFVCSQRGVRGASLSNFVSGYGVRGKEKKVRFAFLLRNFFLQLWPFWTKIIHKLGFCMHPGQ